MIEENINDEEAKTTNTENDHVKKILQQTF